MSGEHEVSEADLDAVISAAFGRGSAPVSEEESAVEQAVAEAFGRQEPWSDGALIRAAFVEAGFSEEQAGRGLAMLESGRYAGFEDAATSLMMFAGTGGGRPAAGVTAERIRESGQRLRGKLELSESSLDAWCDEAFGPVKGAPGSVTGQ